MSTTPTASVVISGSGNVAIYACQKATELGGKVVTMSDSNGYVYDPNGIDLAYVKDLKEVRRGRIKEYADTHPGATYVPDCHKIWETPCDIALPCATQNEIDKHPSRRNLCAGLPQDLGDPLRHRSALRYPERDRQGFGGGSGQGRLHRGVRGRKYAQHSGGH